MKIIKKIRLFILSSLLIIITISLFWIKYEGPLPLQWELYRFLIKNNISGINGGILYPDGSIKTYSLGHRESKIDKPLSIDDPMVLASLSKPITAMITRHLIDSEIINYDDKLTQLLPDIEYADDKRYAKITIRHLLQHRAGFDRQISGDPIVTESGSFSCDNAIDMGTKKPLDFTPDSRYVYSNIGYCLLGRILEKKGDHQYDTLLKNLLHAKKSEALIERIYLDQASLSDDDNLILTPPLTYTDLKNILPVGGIISDVKTLLALYHLEMDQLELISNPPSALSGHEESFYGLGWRIWPEIESDKITFTHFGSLPHRYAFAMISPNRHIIVLFFEGNIVDYEPKFIQLMALFKQRLR